MSDMNNENNEDLDFFISDLNELGLKADQKQLGQFRKYYEMLIEYNRSVNLTTITEFREVFIKHFIDSLAIVKAGIDIGKFSHILDMGTGAGFPGIPIKIMFPDTEVTLVDSLQKRVVFLNKVIDECGLENIRAVHSRAEDFCKIENSRETYDICVSRAVAHLNILEEYCLPYIRVNGYMISYKSGVVSDEIKEAEHAARLLGGDILKDHDTFYLPGTDISRILVVIKKIKRTDRMYPRKAGLPAKKPL